MIKTSFFEKVFIELHGSAYNNEFKTICQQIPAWKLAKNLKMNWSFPFSHWSVYYYIWSSQKCLAKNRQLNRLNIQPCLKAAEPSSAAHIILLLVWSGSGNKGNSRLGWLADCPDIIRFLSGVKINGWGSILTTPFYLLSDCDSEQQLKVCWI